MKNNKSRFNRFFGTSCITLLSLWVATLCSANPTNYQKKQEKNKAKETLLFRSPNIFNDKKAQVRTDLLLCEKEKQALSNRKLKTYRAIRNLVDLPLVQGDIPSIGIVCSGGGFKAAVATIGLLQGLEDIKLLDGISYISTLSGSTWSTATWLTHAQSLQELEVYLQNKLDHAFKPEKICVEALAYNLVNKMQSKQTVSINDLWGGMLGDIFFSRAEDFGGQNTYLSDLEESTLSAQKPIPLFSAVIANMAPIYQWVEFSPFEVGSTALEAWIPTWAFGRQFNMGVSAIEGHQENFGYLLGLFGSLYATCVPQSLDVIEKNLKTSCNLTVPVSWQEYISTTFLGKQRISPPEIYNFTYNMKKSPYRKQEKITFIDGSVALPLPFPPLMRRNIDVYIVCDAPDFMHKINKHPLLHTKEYAQEHDLAFPSNINSNTIKTDAFTFFIDQSNINAPIIIYIQNNEKVSRSDLNYTKEDFYNVLRNTKNTVIENVETIKDIIRYAIDIKKLGFSQMRATISEKKAASAKAQNPELLETRSPQIDVPMNKFRSLPL